MLNKEGIIAQVNALSVLLNVAPDNFVITAGSAAVMHGLREVTEDVDIDVMPHMWEYLKRHYPTHPIQKALCGEVMCFTPLVSIHLARVEDQYMSMMLDGLEVLDLPSLRAQYLMLSKHPSRTVEKLQRDKDTIINIQLKIDNEWNTRPIRNVGEATAVLQDVVKMNFELARLSDFFKRNPDEIAFFVGHDEKAWFGSGATKGHDGEPVVKLQRSACFTASDVRPLISQDGIKHAFYTTTKDRTIQLKMN